MGKDSEKILEQSQMAVDRDYKIKHKIGTLRTIALSQIYFIYKCNLNEQSLLSLLFKIQLRENRMTERYIAVKSKTPKLFNEKWKCLILKDFVPEILPPQTSH